MAGYRIAVMEGDGIGPEVVGAACRVLEAALAREPAPAVDFVPLPVGLAAFEAHGSTLPTATLAALEGCDGWLLGPLTTHVYQGEAMPNASAALRTGFQLYANLRPARSYSGVAALHQDVDLVVVRENTEGFYADRNLLDGNGELRPDADTVLSLRVVTRRASERIARAGFELARRRRQHVTLVHKANVLRRGDGLFLEVARQVAAGYPEVAVDDYHVDAFAMHLVLRPRDYDVIVTTNLFGDVLSDEAAGLIGGLGLAPGLNAGERYAMAQAVHGSAPDIAGQGIANPAASILSAAMLCDWLGARHGDGAARAVATRIDAAVAAALRDPRAHTPDLGGCATTEAMTEAIVAALG
ncbi:MAG TPA: isocitrate/isopropylmalate dehydrogenase family protein [Thermomicrobiaceae bacterium]|nr:isocitrate/isopropylmalate dehydrogenase family protein [Thermomicrobiaceae bacterium]